MDVNDFNEVRDCIYKDEHYSVRDNGAVMRHPREGKRKRKDDNIWSFGKPNEKTGYMEIGGQRVHRIVAFAFHGEPPTEQHVVDHIDTNRKNNRPDNLRWLTRLENALKNPITCRRIEIVCGSIEAFLANPSILRGHEHVDPNFNWMRTVSPEEASVSFERLTKWANENSEPQGGSLGEWIFQENKSYRKQDRQTPYMRVPPTESTQTDNPVETKSLTPNAIQINWKHPVDFICCPQKITDNPLKTYMENIKVGKVFCKNDFGESTILKFNLTEANELLVMCSIHIAWKTHAITKISYNNGVFYHNNIGVYDIGDEPENIFESMVNPNKQI